MSAAPFPTMPDATHQPEAPFPSEPEGALRLAPGVVLPRDVVRFETARSSGPGGQNVNKRSTKVRLRVRLDDLPINLRAKMRLRRLASANLTEQGELLIECDDSRSQRRNREACVARLGELVRSALVPPKVRKETKPSRGAIERRIKAKKERGQRKQQRRKKDW